MPAAKRPRAVVQSSTSATKRAIVNERASFASVTTFASNFSHQTLSCSCEMPGASLGCPARPLHLLALPPAPGTTAAPAGAAAGAATGTGTATAAAATSAAAVPCAAAAVLIFNRALKLAVHVLLRCAAAPCSGADGVTSRRRFSTLL